MGRSLGEERQRFRGLLGLSSKMKSQTGRAWFPGLCFLVKRLMIMLTFSIGTRVLVVCVCVQLVVNFSELIFKFYP